MTNYCAHRKFDVGTVGGEVGVAEKSDVGAGGGWGGGLGNPKMDNVICEPSQRRFFVLLQRLSAGHLLCNVFLT